MGIRAQLTETQDIKISGFLADALIDAGLANTDEDGFITDVSFELTREELVVVVKHYNRLLDSHLSAVMAAGGWSQRGDFEIDKLECLSDFVDDMSDGDILTFN